jgi:hypothetical protein
LWKRKERKKKMDGDPFGGAADPFGAAPPLAASPRGITADDADPFLASATLSTVSPAGPAGGPSPAVSALLSQLTASEDAARAAERECVSLRVAMRERDAELAALRDEMDARTDTRLLEHFQRLSPERVANLGARRTSESHADGVCVLFFL